MASSFVTFHLAILHIFVNSWLYLGKASTGLSVRSSILYAEGLIDVADLDDSACVEMA